MHVRVVVLLLRLRSHGKDEFSTGWKIWPNTLFTRNWQTRLNFHFWLLTCDKFKMAVEIERFFHSTSVMMAPDELSTGWKFVLSGVLFTRNHVKRTKIWTSSRSKFVWTEHIEHRIYSAISNGSVWRKSPFKFFSRSKISPIPWERSLYWASLESLLL